MHSRIRLCIPVYNNPATIITVIKECLEKTVLPLVVIDDGSQTPVNELCKDEIFREALASSRLVILRHPINEGKGAALRTAFKDSVAKGYTHLLNVDGDGQHLVSEIPQFISAIQKNPWALIIGNRRLDAAHVPEVSRFGRKFSNFWVRYETDAKVADSQCGMRAYPLYLLQGIRFWTTGFEFEIEVLIRFLWRRGEVNEIPIEVLYQPPQERVSHFHKFTDNVRISSLNTLLVIARLFREGFQPLPAGIAVGLGVVIGCSPLYGLHAIIAVLLAFFLKLNAVLLVIGTQISIPPLAPLLAAASFYIGGWIRQSLALPISAYLDWPLGALVLGTGLGTIAGGITYLVVVLSERRKNRTNVVAWNGRMRGGVGNHFLKAVAKVFGLRSAYFCLYFIVPYFYVFAPKGRRALHEYYGYVAPDKSAFRHLILILGHMHRFGQIILDRLAQTESKTPYFEFVSTGFENIKEPLTSGEGIILLSAHVGAWDLASAYVYHHQVNQPFHLVQYGDPVKNIEKFKGSDEVLPPKVIYSNREQVPILSLHRLLAEGRAVALMGDRPIGKHFELIPFFGHLAPFDTTAFKLAATTGKPLLFSFNFKGAGRAYRFSATPKRYYKYAPGRDRDEQCREWAQEFATCLEEKVREYTDQWFNFFPFWSTPPAPPGPLERITFADSKKTSATLIPTTA